MAHKGCGTLCKLSLAAAILMVALFATNPSEHDYREHLKKEIRKEAEHSGGVAGFILRSLSSPAVTLATLDLQRQNYHLFSLYRINIAGNEVVYIGILRHFILIE